MQKYKLQPNEVVLHSSGMGVQRGTKLLGLFNGELVLTNLHLIWVGKGPLGNVKQVEYFPLSHIKVFNDRAQVRLAKNFQGIPQLEVFFQNGQEVFKFAIGQHEIEIWIEAITRAVAGNRNEPAKATTRALPSGGVVAEVLRETVSRMWTPLETGPVAGSSPPPVTVSSKCTGCGAPISGPSGSAAKCEFCDSESMLA